MERQRLQQPSLAMLATSGCSFSKTASCNSSGRFVKQGFAASTAARLALRVRRGDGAIRKWTDSAADGRRAPPHERFPLDF